ncbi:MAG: DUF6034 family protein [Clostridiales bacterium]|nr:DUF6034 family protein [Clostridiales bacterium]
MKRVFIIATALLLLLGSFACQPTPEKDIIINKGDANKFPVTGDIGDGEKNPAIKALLQIESVPFAPYDAPKRVTREGEKRSGVTVRFDAEVDIPPVYGGYAVTLVEKRALSDETIRRWAQYIAGDTQLVKMLEKSKADYVEELKAIQETLAELQEQYDTAVKYAETAPSWMDQVQELEGWIEDCKQGLADTQKKFNRAPDSAVSVPLDLNDYPRGEWFMFEKADGRGVFQTMRGGNCLAFWYSQTTSYQWESWFQDLSSVPQEDRHWYNVLQEKFSFTKEQARAISDAALAEMGELSEYVQTSFDKGLLIEHNRVQSQVWRVEYSRNNHGLPFYRQLITIEQNSSAPPVVGAPWEPEFIYFVVDENGIRYFTAWGLGTETMVLVDNVELLPFDSVLQRMESLLQQIYAVGTGGETEVRIERIELRSALISLPNEMNRGISIPVWHFSGTNESNGVTLPFAFTIDARDGAYIEPSLPTTALASYG